MPGRPNRSGIDWSDPAARARYKRQSERHQEYNARYYEEHKEQRRAQMAKVSSDRRARLRAMRGGVRRTARPAALAYWKRPRGERHYRTSLTESDIREIRRRHAAGKSYTALGAEFGLQKSAIYKIVKRITWKHVKDGE